jgi:hypothetical protein
MKKSILFLFSLMFLVSCGPNVKEEALKNLDNSAKSMLKNPQSLQATEKEVVYLDDSLCVINYKMSAQNGFGGYSSNKATYVFWKMSSDARAKEKTEAKYKDLTFIFQDLDADNDDYATYSMFLKLYPWLGKDKKELESEKNLPLKITTMLGLVGSDVKEYED